MLQSKFAFAYGLPLGVGLALGGTVMLASLPALAAPDPIFDPAFEEISASALTNQALRLPAVVPTEVELHLLVIETDDTIVLRLDTAPDCLTEECFGIMIATTSAERPNWPPTDESLIAVDLGDGVQGYNYPGTDGSVGSVEWIQGESFYSLAYQTELFTTEEAIAMATSMASEPPINSVPE